MRKPLYSTFVIASILIGGCQATRDNNDASYNLQKDQTRPGIMSNRTITDLNRDRTHGMDAQNRNPNFPNLNGTINGTASGGSGNHATDTDQAKRVINHTKDFRPQSIWIERHMMNITVSDKRKMTSKERKKAAADLHRKLIQALPRYSINVKTANK